MCHFFQQVKSWQNCGSDTRECQMFKVAITERRAPDRCRRLHGQLAWIKWNIYWAQTKRNHQDGQPLHYFILLKIYKLMFGKPKRTSSSRSSRQSAQICMSIHCNLPQLTQKYNHGLYLWIQPRGKQGAGISVCVWLWWELDHITTPTLQVPFTFNDWLLSGNILVVTSIWFQAQSDSTIYPVGEPDFRNQFNKSHFLLVFIVIDLFTQNNLAEFLYIKIKSILFQRHKVENTDVDCSWLSLGWLKLKQQFLYMCWF